MAHNRSSTFANTGFYRIEFRAAPSVAAAASLPQAEDRGYTFDVGPPLRTAPAEEQLPTIGVPEAVQPRGTFVVFVPWALR